MTREFNIQKFEEQIEIAEKKTLKNNNLNDKFKAFYNECQEFLKTIAKHSDREISRTLLFLTEMNVMAEKFDLYTSDEFIKQSEKIHSLKAGTPERICSYGLKFLITATLTISMALLTAMYLITIIPASIPLIPFAIAGGAIIGFAMGVCLANEHVDSRCNRFFRPSDSKLIKEGETFLVAASCTFGRKNSDNYENYTPKKVRRIYNPNGDDSSLMN